MQKCWLWWGRLALAGLFGMGISGAALAESKIGVVLMHGKWGNPGTVISFADQMESSGYLVENIEMPWSGRRSYDAGADAFLGEIDAAVQRLKSKGASKIVVAGHSLGAAGGLHYVGRKQADGFIAIAPGHSPEGGKLRDMFADSVAKARDMVARGAGEEKGWFDDFNTGNRTKQVSMTAQVYLDFFAPDGPMNFTGNAAKILPGTNVLWVVPTQEESGLKGLSARALPLIPASVKVQKIEVEADHMGAPDRSAEPALAWIRETVH
jgi:pimeloyl-ACP methyl ester carboxylesterase